MNEVTHQIASALKTVTKTAITPGLFLTVILIMGAIPLAIYADDWIAIWIMCLLSLVVISVTVTYLYHSFYAPHLLQSEDYLLKKDAITIYGSSSFEGRQIVDIVSSSVPALPTTGTMKTENE